MFSSNAAQVADANFIEDVFSTWLYTGNGSTQTINNGIDLAGKGGLVWLKSRSAATDHALYDTARGATFDIASNTTAAQTAQAQGLTSFLANGFSIGSLAKINTSAATYASWTFREQPRFFDIVTYTGNGANRTIAHNLGSVPGCIIVKRTDATASWPVYHRSLGNTQYMLLNSSSPPVTSSTFWNNTTPTNTVFTVGPDAIVNANGGTYVAYLFAHNAGGFGEDGTENVISCGVATLNSGGDATVSLGYEPQWIITRRTEGTVTYNWEIYDFMRKFAVSDNNTFLSANSSDAENTSSYITPTATGFQITTSLPSTDFIYIAIRRGPMRTPTTGTSVFAINTATNSSPAFTSNFPVDMSFNRNISAISDTRIQARLTGNRFLETNTTDAEGDTSAIVFDYQSGWGSGFPTNTSIYSWMLRRAPGFFDVVCYTGNGSANTQSHNLGVAPELVITKSRSSAQNWLALHTFTVSNHQLQFLNTTDAQSATTYASNGFLSSQPTATQLPVTGPYLQINGSGTTYVAYLFASCPGVSRVGSYTGTGATQVVNCGFAAGSRFVLIKRTDSTGDWYVWDSARGIVAANDPYLRLNSTAAEVTNTDWVDTAASGFELSNAGGNLVNTNGGSYIFLAIA